MKILTFLKLLLITISFTGCIITGKNGVPNGGAAIIIEKPVWLSGIRLDDDGYSSKFPEAGENEYLKTVSAGYWLENTNQKKSQLIYNFKINIKKPFANKKVWTKMILSNPSDENNNIIYTHYLEKKDKSTGGTHGTLSNVNINKKYNMILEVYEDKDRTKLISKLNQTIVSPVDNTNGCIKLNRKFKKEKFGFLVDKKNVLTQEHLIVWCDK